MGVKMKPRGAKLRNDGQNEAPHVEILRNECQNEAPQGAIKK